MSAVAPHDVGRAVDGGPADPGVLAAGEGGDGGENHAWDLGIWWDVYFTLTMLGMVLLALVEGDPGERWLPAALTAGVIVVYYVVGKRLLLLDGSDWVLSRSLVLSGLVLLCVLPAVMLSPPLTFMLIAVAPLLFMTCGSGVATPSIGIILLVPVLLRGLLGTQDWDSVLVNVLINSAILGYSLWFGRWFELIVEQSWERAELIRDLRESRSEAARLSEETGAMAERERLAREMHDTLAQGLTSIIALTQAVESEMDDKPRTARRHLALMRETAAENLAEARAMVAARQPVPFGGEQLDAVLERITARIGGELAIAARSRVEGTPVPLPNDLQICLLRTAQEALANVRRHAGADSVEVALEYTDTGVALTVSDDGRGFVLGEARAGNGLANMGHRAESVGGTLEVESVPGAGTAVRMALPLPGAGPGPGGRPAPVGVDDRLPAFPVPSAHDPHEESRP